MPSPFWPTARKISNPLTSSSDDHAYVVATAFESERMAAVIDVLIMFYEFLPSHPQYRQFLRACEQPSFAPELNWLKEYRNENLNSHRLLLHDIAGRDLLKQQVVQINVNVEIGWEHVLRAVQAMEVLQTWKLLLGAHANQRLIVVLPGRCEGRRATLPSSDQHAGCRHRSCFRDEFGCK